jgi:hypothetical protein
MADTDTVETLRTDLDALRAEFETFRSYGAPVIDGHQPQKATPSMDAQQVAVPSLQSQQVFWPLSEILYEEQKQQEP